MIVAEKGRLWRWIRTLALGGLCLFPVSQALAARIFWADQTTGEIASSKLDGTQPSPVLNTFSPRGLAVDTVGREMFWAIDEPRVPIGFTGEIDRAGLDGQNITEVALDLPDPFHVEFESAGNWVYWTDRFTMSIRRAHPDGSENEEIVPDVESPSGLAVDSTNGRIYWSEHSTDPESNPIHSATLEGTDVMTFDTGRNLPYDLAVDALRGKVYWSFINPDIDGLYAGFIQQANLDFSDEEPVAAGLGGPRALAIDAAAGKLYWTDWNEVTGEKGRIQRSDLDGQNRQDLIMDLVTPFGLALDLLRVPGDANDDDLVNLADFNILKANFGTGSLVTQGDFNASLSVDLEDFNILKENFGAGQSVSVLEPGSVTLATIAVGSLLGVFGAPLRRRRGVYFNFLPSTPSSSEM